MEIDRAAFLLLATAIAACADAERARSPSPPLLLGADRPLEEAELPEPSAAPAPAPSTMPPAPPPPPLAAELASRCEPLAPPCGEGLDYRHTCRAFLRFLDEAPGKAAAACLLDENAHRSLYDFPSFDPSTTCFERGIDSAPASPIFDPEQEACRDLAQRCPSVGTDVTCLRALAAVTPTQRPAFTACMTETCTVIDCSDVLVSAERAIAQ